MSMLKKNLEQMMKAAGDDANTLAAKTGVAQAFIEGIVSGGIDTEAGDELAPLRAADKIAKRYGVTLDHMVNTELTPITVFAPKAVVDFYNRNPNLAADMAARVSRYVAPSIRDIGGGRIASWGESIATSATSGATSGATAGVVAYSVVGPTPLPGPE